MKILISLIFTALVSVAPLMAQQAEVRVNGGSENLFVDEDQGVALISIERIGSAVGELSIGFSQSLFNLSNGATEGQDFLGNDGVLTWPDGELGSKVVAIAIENDDTAENREDFSFYVFGTNETPNVSSNPLLVSIVDNDTLMGDIDLDGAVGFSDFLALAKVFGQSATFFFADLNLDGTVNFSDFLILAGNFGKSL